jgi:hypothetical protein
MTITNGYATLAEVKAYIDTASTNAGDDAVIEDMVEMASRLIDTLTLRTFYARTETHYFNYSGERGLIMDDDLLTVTTLTNGDDEIIASTEYNLLPFSRSPKHEIKLKQSSTYGWSIDTDGNTEGVISVVGTWGYSTTAPADIKHACISIVISAYHKRYGQGLDGTAQITSMGVVITPNDIPKEAWTIINPYRRRV